MHPVLAATGHRPAKLGGFGVAAYDSLVVFAWLYLRQCPPDARVISGMAMGWDMAYADAAWRLGIPFTAAVPFDGQEARWPDHARARYRQTLARASRVVVVSPGGYTSEKMNTRNQWMVDNCTGVVALWNGTPGGTANCVRYAEASGRPIVNLWPTWAATHPT